MGQGPRSHDQKSQLGTASQPQPSVVGQVPLSRRPAHESVDMSGHTAGAGTRMQSLATPELEAAKTSDGKGANSLLPAMSQVPSQDSDQESNLDVPDNRLPLPTIAEEQSALACQNTMYDKASPPVVPVADEITSEPSQTSTSAAVEPSLFGSKHVAKAAVQETPPAAGVDSRVPITEGTLDQAPILAPATPSRTPSGEARNALSAVQIRLARGNESEAETSDSSGGWDA